VDYRLLGPLRVTNGDGSPTVIDRPLERAVLAYLLLHAGRQVSDARFVDALWGDKPPDAAINSLQVRVSRLRRQLGSDAIERMPGGYLLHANEDQVDVHRFERLLEAGRRLIGDGEHEQALRMFAEALALWSGPALTEVGDAAFVGGERARLENLREDTEDAHAEVLLALGESEALIPGLREAVGREPFRERRRAQLMRALYRDGQQAQALEVYREGRLILRNELGLEPTGELRALQAAILNQDPALDPPARSRWPSGRLRRRPPALLAAAVVIVAGVLVLAALVASRTGRTQRVRANSIGVIDAASNRVSGDIAVGARPISLAVGADAVWAGSEGDRTITRIDPRNLRSRTVGVGEPPLAIAVVNGSLWVATGGATLVHLDPLYSYAAEQISVAGATETVAADARNVWVGVADPRTDTGALQAFDPATARSTWRIALQSFPRRAVVAAGDVWIGGGTVLEDEGAVVEQVDPRNHIEVNAVPVGASGASGDIAGPVGLVSLAGRIWTATAGGPLVGIGSDRERRATIPLAANPNALAAGAGSLWVALTNGTIDRIDPRSATITRRIHVGYIPTALAFGFGRLWVAVGAA
jgi:DNA-binding SARP family transcriptional activator